MDAARIDDATGRGALATVRAADAICVIEHGRVVERGTHLELLAAGGRYADLYRTQFADDRAVSELPALDPRAAG